MNTPTETVTPRSKMVHEQVIEQLSANASKVLSTYPEVRGLMIAIDWNIGQNDFPPNVVMTKEVTEQTSLEMLKQAIKLLDSILTVFNKQIVKADSILKQAQSLVQKTQLANKDSP